MSAEAFLPGAPQGVVGSGAPFGGFPYDKTRSRNMFGFTISLDTETEFAFARWNIFIAAPISYSRVVLADPDPRKLKSDLEVPAQTIMVGQLWFHIREIPDEVQI